MTYLAMVIVVVVSLSRSQLVPLLQRYRWMPKPQPGLQITQQLLSIRNCTVFTTASIFSKSNKSIFFMID